MDNKNKEGDDHNTQNSNDTKKKRKKLRLTKRYHTDDQSLFNFSFGAVKFDTLNTLNNLVYRFEATRIAAFTFEKASDIGKRYSTRFLYTPTRSFQKQPPHTHTYRHSAGSKKLHFPLGKPYNCSSTLYF